MRLPLRSPFNHPETHVHRAEPPAQCQGASARNVVPRALRCSLAGTIPGPGRARDHERRPRHVPPAHATQGHGAGGLCGRTSAGPGSLGQAHSRTRAPAPRGRPVAGAPARRPRRSGGGARKRRDRKARGRRTRREGPHAHKAAHRRTRRSFGYFEPSLQSTLHPSIGLLVCYRSRASDQPCDGYTSHFKR